MTSPGEYHFQQVNNYGGKFDIGVDMKFNIAGNTI
jgi:hypothetical protein